MARRSALMFRAGRALVLALILVAACRNDGAAPDIDDADPLDQLDEATTLLVEQLGAPLELTELTVHVNGDYRFEVNDPVIVENLDVYLWSDGAFGPPEPVYTGPDPDFEDRLFSIEGLELEDAAKRLRVRADEEAADLEGGVYYAFFLERNSDGDLEWSVHISGARTSLTLYAPPDATTAEVR